MRTKTGIKDRLIDVLTGTMVGIGVLSVGLFFSEVVPTGNGLGCFVQPAMNYVHRTHNEVCR